MVFLKSHPGHIVNCVTVNAFIVRHFTGSQVGEKDNVQIFSLSRRMRILDGDKIFPIEIGIFQREIWKNIRLPDV